VKAGLEPRFFDYYASGPDDDSPSQADYFEKHQILSGDISPHRYIQGLRFDDPRDLIVMYRKTLTEWETHYHRAEKARWLVMPPGSFGHWCSEPGGWIDTPELKRRLTRTLTFLRENKRPHWEQTIKEHQPFIEALGMEGSPDRKSK